MNIQPEEEEKLKAVASTANSDSGSHTNFVDDVFAGVAALIGDADDSSSSSSSDAVDGVVSDGVNEEEAEEEKKLKAVSSTAGSDSVSDTNVVDEVIDVVDDVLATVLGGTGTDVPAAVKGDSDGDQDKRMNSSHQEIEATAFDDDDGGGNNSQHKANRVPYGMSLSNDVNITNCYKHCQHLFNRYKHINKHTMICYWLMAGYLDGAPSLEEAILKAEAILADLKTEWGIAESNWTGTLSLPQEPPREPIKCRHKGFCVLENLGFVNLLDLPDFPLPKEHLFGWLNPLLTEKLPYAATFNPTTKNLTSFFGDEKMTKYLTLLLVRGGDLFPLGEFLPSANLQNLTILEISGSCLTFFPTEAMSKLTRLQSLNLSHLPIERIPHGSFHKLTQLRWLIIRGCSKLRSFPSIDHLIKLEALDLSHCPSLQQPIFLEIKYPNLQMLDLSFTPVVYGFRELSTPNLTHLSLRGLKMQHLFLQEPYLLKLRVLDLSECEHLVSLSPLIHVPRLEQLNLSGCSRLTGFHEALFDQIPFLVNLDLSWTKVKHLPPFVHLTSLRRLSLRGLELDSLEALTSLSNHLVELDLLGLKIEPSQQLNLDFLECLDKLEILNLSNTSVEKLPDMSKLVSLKELLLADCHRFQVVPNLLTLTNLETLDLPGSDVKDRESKLPAKQKPRERRISMPVEIHIIRGEPEEKPQSDDHFENASMKLGALISDILTDLNSAKAAIETDDEGFKMQIETIYTNLKYIEENKGGFKSSRDWKSKEGLLHDLMDAATFLSRIDDFRLDFDNFKKLHQLVFKLKLLVPPKETNDSNADLELANKKKKKKKSLFARRKNMEKVGDMVKDMKGMGHGLLPSYQSLSDVEKNCLLCFSVFPYDEEGDRNTCILKSLVIKNKTLIYWWVGEGFIDSYDEENVENPKTIEEIGKQILKVLVEKEFIEAVIKKGIESGSCCMHPFVHSFVIDRAKEEGFFDFDKDSCDFTRCFSRSRRACLLKRDKFPSSCELWAAMSNNNSPYKEHTSFANVKTLFNVDESRIDIKREWFDKMESLHVLHLGIWRSENTDFIELEDQMFLEDLKRMKQLRLLSLQGLPAIIKLPDSICQLDNLIILDLKECSYLEELPADIGSLKSLTHLDISNCTLLTKLPKGISLLSKLQVLRGLVITSQHVVGGSQDGRNVSTLSRWWQKTTKGMFRFKKNEACTVQDLLRLERLRELSMVVNRRTFPDDDELKVFKEMKQLRKLKIFWERSIHSEDKSASENRYIGDNIDQQTFKEHLDSIEKLELWCFPNEIAPHWLNPSELNNLKKLHIVGGNLRELQGGISENKWNVTTLRLKYLHNLSIRWSELKTMFPQLMHLEKDQCDKLADFPCYHEEGVWRSAS